MVGNISSSLSALNAFATKLNVASRNASNVNTDGYKAERAVMAERGGGVYASVEKTGDPSPVALETRGGVETLVEKSNADLAGSMVDMMVASRSFEANVKAIKTADEMTGTVLDLKG